MNLEQLCRNCMQGTIINGVCNRCGKPVGDDGDRPVYALPAGHLLCRQYYLGRVLGHGGFGITYLAWDTRNNRRVAIKELFLNTDMTRASNAYIAKVNEGQESYLAHIRQRFLEEAQALYEFSNVADIINVYHLFQENGTAYYAMEFLEGRDLKSVLKTGGRMSWEQLSVYVRMILRALNALHARSLIHRDISPDNIFLTVDGRAKLIDFGSLRSYNSGRGLTTILKQQFAPYEQYRTNGKQGPWTDIYSLSITMYYALSGLLAPKAPDRVLEDRAVPIAEQVPNLPPHVAAAIWKGMAVAPEDRYQNVSDFYMALFPGESLPPVVQSSMPPVPPAQSYVPPQNRVTGNTNIQNQAAGNLRPQSPPTGNTRPQRSVCCIAGYYSGNAWNISRGMMITVGRDRRCIITYPPNAQGISRLQCSFAYNENRSVYVRDENSTYGTFVNGTRLKPGVWYPLRADSIITFGQEKYMIR